MGSQVKESLPKYSVQDYLNRSGDDSLASGQIATNGDDFCIWSATEDALVLIQVYGDGQYWDEWAASMAKQLGKDKIMFATKRNPNGFTRKFKYKITGYILERDV